MKGLIPGNSYIDIEIEYIASKPITSVLNIILETSQSGFSPLPIRIMGSGRYKDLTKTFKKKRPKSKIMKYNIPPAEDQGEIDIELDEAKPIQDKAFRLRNIRLKRKDKIMLKTEGGEAGFAVNNIRTLKKRNSFQIAKNEKPRQLTKDEIKNLKEDPSKQEDSPEDNLKSNLERMFLDRFNEIEQLTKDKEIKMFRCIGDPKMTHKEQNAVLDRREDFHEKMLNRIQDEGIHRYDKIVDGDLPIYLPVMPFYKPTWDQHKNNPNKLRKMRLAKFMRCATKVVLDYRVNKRISKIKQYLGNLLISKNKDDIQQFLKDDWHRADYMGAGRANFIKFEFDFGEANLGTGSLCIQYDNKIDQINDKYNTTPTIGFDDLSHIDALQYNDAELLQLKPRNLFALHLYPPMMTNSLYRRGAESEYPYRIYLSKFRKLGPNGVISENKLEKHIFKALPTAFTFPPDILSHACVCPHNTMRKYFALVEFTEVDHAYLLRWEVIEFLDVLKPKEGDNVKDLLYEYMTTTPGYSSLRYFAGLRIELSHYYKKRVALPEDVFFEERFEEYCPDIIYNKEKDDELSEEDSDDENAQLEITTVDVEEFNVEDVDAEFKDKLAKFEEEISDERDNIWSVINRNFKQEKKKNIAILPTMTSDYNKYIKFQQNKLFVI